MNRADKTNFLRNRIQEIDGRIGEACRRAGRSRSEITLVAVTKTVSVEVASDLVAAGVTDLGENRPQELWKKAAILDSKVRWHLIGHLQRNKVEKSLPFLHLLQSADSLRLLEALEKEASARNSPLPVLLQVNVSREGSKQGFSPEELPGLVPALSRFRHLRLEGLMTIAAYDAEPENCRSTFALLRSLRDQMQTRWGDAAFRQLSMGMSNDFEVAVEEGATLVRIGSALFEGLDGAGP